MKKRKIKTNNKKKAADNSKKASKLAKKAAALAIGATKREVGKACDKNDDCISGKCENDKCAKVKSAFQNNVHPTSTATFVDETANSVGDRM